jgi:hypothetical protein
MADFTVRTYDPERIKGSLGVIPLSGYADGTYITIARQGDAFEARQGADGTVDRINKRNKHFLVTITLMQTSQVNNLLSAQLIADIESNTGVVPLEIVDLNGTTLFFARAAWIQKDPDDEFADTLGNREWVIATGPADKFTGGNL